MGVSKEDWKQLISDIGVIEKEFEFLLFLFISSMQKKLVYDCEIFECIYELVCFFGLGYEVFDFFVDFCNWLFVLFCVLGNCKFFDFFDSSFGFELVENEIVCIQCNVYS